MSPRKQGPGTKWIPAFAGMNGVWGDAAAELQKLIASVVTSWPSYTAHPALINPQPEIEFCQPSVVGRAFMQTKDKTGRQAEDSAYNEFLIEVDRRIDAERQAREIALAAQDHRLISNINNLIRAIISPSDEKKRDRIAASAGALAWCFIPTTGTTTVGIVAIASLFLAWQQAHLLSVQNDKIEIQNLLSEAQRRSGLLFETTAIFQAIDEEKRRFETDKKGGNALDPAQCRDNPDSEVCWHVGTSGTRLFVPSQATIGRVAALTQALRPYRYLSVEDARPYRFIGNDLTNGRPGKEICPHTITSATLDAAHQIINRVIHPWEGDERLKDPKELKAEIAKIYENNSAIGITSTFERAKTFIFNAIDSDSPFGDIALNCAPASPERGQLLISLHAASVDISRIAARGGDFRYSDIPGAYLEKIALKNVDLSFSRLSNANFRGAYLEDVSFVNAHLAGARFRGAALNKVNFNNAIAQTFSDGAAASGPFLAEKAHDNLLTGMRFVELEAKMDLHARMCTALSMLSRLDKSFDMTAPPKKIAFMDELDRFALLVETAVKNPSRPAQLIGVIIPNIGNEELILYEREHTTRLEYAPFRACKWPRGTSESASR